MAFTTYQMVVPDTPTLVTGSGSIAPVNRTAFMLHNMGGNPIFVGRSDVNHVSGFVVNPGGYFVSRSMEWNRNMFIGGSGSIPGFNRNPWYVVAFPGKQSRIAVLEGS